MGSVVAVWHVCVERCAQVAAHTRRYCQGAEGFGARAATISKRAGEGR